MISTNDLRSGQTIEYEGQIYLVLEAQHVKPGKGQAFVRSKLRNLHTGSIIDRTLPAGEKVAEAHVERRPMQYLYPNGDEYVLMDEETYEQIAVPAERLGEQVKFLKENMVLSVSLHEGRVIDVELPHTVELRVAHTEPGIRGDTASGATKPATLETGAVVRVPLFVQTDDILKIDTRTGSYISRA